jgi:hypothetical protein
VVAGIGFSERVQLKSMPKIKQKGLSPQIISYLFIKRQFTEYFTIAVKLKRHKNASSSTLFSM